jgi:hypothetical protein
MDVFPTAYFPSISYLNAFFSTDSPFIEIHENFPKQTIRNRCEILTSNGVLILSVPVVHFSGRKEKTSEIRIDYSKNWQLDHIRAIQSAYASSPYFEEYFQDVQELIKEKNDLLIEKNNQILCFLNQLLDKKSKFNFTSEFQNKIASQKSLFLERETLNKKEYQQVFSYSKPFVPNLSMLDLIFNEGPFCRNWILSSEN